MNVRPLMHGAVDGLRVNLPVRARQQQDLGAVGEELRRAALGGLDVRLLVAQNAVIRLAQRGQRKRVGRGAVEDEEHLAVGLEYIANEVGRLLRPGVVAVADFVALVGLGHRGKRLRANPGIIVTGKLAAGSSFSTHAGIVKVQRRDESRESRVAAHILLAFEVVVNLLRRDVSRQPSSPERPAMLTTGLFRRKSLDQLVGETADPRHQLRRALGPVQLTLLGVGAIIGAGIFSTVGTAARAGGAGSSIWGGAGAGVILCAGGDCLRLCGAVLFGVRLDGAGVRFGLHLRVCHARGADRLDHWLGPDPRIRHRQRGGGDFLVGLLPEPAGRVQAVLAGLAGHRFSLRAAGRPQHRRSQSRRD